MNFDSYSLYSATSMAKNKDEHDLQQTLQQTQAFLSISTVEEAKKILKDMWNIEQSIKNKPLSGNCILSLEENEEILSIRFDYKNNVDVYSYRK